ncbi:DUF1634 domain-containing protein [Paenibacillus popilliae]|uniref:DUF1634 domain-containing protein n=1 Tax=Paenibacillus popilliae TaxID=78057 RepID=A0ABY3ANF9_PAEPP|nr:DUF1634 domain-containing protein [Paenibacillus sp. SDF0028]
MSELGREGSVQQSEIEQMRNDKSEAVEIVVSKWLRVGVLASAAVILAGLLLFLISGDSGYPEQTFPTSLAGIYAGLLSIKSYAIILTGLLMLIATPVLRVFISIFVFLHEQDYLYVGITMAVFLILVASFFIGSAG